MSFYLKVGSFKGQTFSVAILTIICYHLIMAPLPKRKHSTQRKGKRLKTRKISLPNLVRCSNCGKMKRPHRICQYCHQ